MKVPPLSERPVTEEEEQDFPTPTSRRKKRSLAARRAALRPWAMGIGLTVVVAVVNLLFVLTPFGRPREPGKTLRITIPEDLEYDGVFDEVLNRYAAESELTEVTTTNMGSLFQLTYQLRLRERGLEKAMIDELRCLNGNLKISLGMTPQGRETL